MDGHKLNFHNSGVLPWGDKEEPGRNAIKEILEENGRENDTYEKQDLRGRGKAGLHL